MPTRTVQANAELNFLFAGQAYVPPGTWYVALYSVAPGYDTPGTELVGSGYERRAITFGAANARVVTNTNQVVFPQATAPWANIVAVGLCSANQGGEPRFWHVLAAPLPVPQGGVVEIQIGNATVTRS